MMMIIIMILLFLLFDLNLFSERKVSVIIYSYVIYYICLVSNMGIKFLTSIYIVITKLRNDRNDHGSTAVTYFMQLQTFNV